MFNALFRGFGKLALLAATAAFLTAVSLLLLGSFLITWPVLRKSPRDQKIQAATNLASAGMVMLATLQKNDTPKS